jgi:hypothetical protein
MKTIWGYTDSTKKRCDGVISVSTPSHGGIRVDKKWAEENLTKEAREAGCFCYDFYWYEEDCDWAIVIFEHPELAISQEEIKHAKRTVVYWHKPYLYKRDLGDMFTIEQLKEQIEDWKDWTSQYIRLEEIYQDMLITKIS